MTTRRIRLGKVEKPPAAPVAPVAPVSIPDDTYGIPASVADEVVRGNYTHIWKGLQLEPGRTVLIHELGTTPHHAIINPAGPMDGIVGVEGWDEKTITVFYTGTGVAKVNLFVQYLHSLIQ